MASDYLSREDAPFGEEIFAKLDGVVASVASAQLSARRLLHIEGPYGLGLKFVPLNDAVVADGDVKVLSSPVLPVPLIQTGFTLSARDLANYEETGFSLDTEAIARAALAAAAAEDTLLFEGGRKLGIGGLMTAEGTQSVKLGKWEEVGASANDIIAGLTALDKAGFHGPYLLGLAPSLYNLLYRLLPQGFQTEMQYVESIVGSKIIKAPGIKNGGVLLAEGRQFASIVIGQDMSVGFVGPQGADFEFKIVESIAPRIRVPESICVLK